MNATNKTRSEVYEEGKQAKIDGKHPLRDNPYNILSPGSDWDDWLDGFDGKPLSQYHHQS